MFGRNRESRRREAAGRRNEPEAVPNGKRRTGDRDRDNPRRSEECGAPSGGRTANWS